MRNASKFNQGCGIDWPLPFDLSVVIFELVGFPEILSCSLVSKQWRDLTRSNPLWKTFFAKEWPDYTQMAVHLVSPGLAPCWDWYTAFKNRYNFDKIAMPRFHEMNRSIVVLEELFHYKTGVELGCVLPSTEFHGWCVSYKDLAPSIHKAAHFLKFKRETINGVDAYHPELDLYKVSTYLQKNLSPLDVAINPFNWHPSSYVPAVENKIFKCPLDYAKIEKHNPILQKICQTIVGSLYGDGATLSFIDIFSCALLACRKTSGVVVYENRLFSYQPTDFNRDFNNDNRSLWHVVRLNDLQPVEFNNIILRTTKEKDNSSTLLQCIKSMAKEKGETIVFARDSGFDLECVDDTLNETLFDKNIRKLRSEFLDHLLQSLQGEYSVDSVCPKDLLTGAFHFICLPAYEDKVISIANTSKRKFSFFMIEPQDD